MNRLNLPIALVGLALAVALASACGAPADRQAPAPAATTLATPTPEPATTATAASGPTARPAGTPPPTLWPPGPTSTLDLLIAPVEGAPAPDLTMTDLNGNEVRLGARRGQPLLLNFWATWYRTAEESGLLGKRHMSSTMTRVSSSCPWISPKRETA